MELRDQTMETVGNTMTEARTQARKITDPARKQVKELQQRGQELIGAKLDRLPADVAQLSGE